MNNLTIKSAFRSLTCKKNLRVTVINIFGLMVATLAFLFVLHYWVFENSFDKFVPSSEQVYRVNMKITEQGRTVFNGAQTPRQLYFSIKQEIPEVEANTLTYFERCLVRRETNRFSDQKVLWVDEGFEKVFPFPLLYGKADFKRPLTGILSESKARSLFGNENPVGKIVYVNQGMEVEVTGVFKDLPSNTHLDAQYFFSLNTFVHFGWTAATGDWGWPGWWNYIRLKPGADAAQAEHAINGFVGRYMGFLKERNQTAQFSLQPLSDLHFVRGLQGEMGASTIPSSLMSLLLIGIFVMTIAWINFVNLTNAQSTERLAKIKIRKLIGATKFHLWKQLFTESLTVSLVSTTMAFVLYRLLVSGFGNFFSVPFDSAFVPWRNIVLFLLVAFIAGIFSSSLYSSVSLFRQSSLAGQQVAQKGGMKKGLVVVQMALSIAFISGSMVVYKQINFMRNFDLGVDLKRVINITGPASNNGEATRGQNYLAFRDEAMKIPGVVAGTAVYNIPGEEPEAKTVQFSHPDAGSQSAPEFRSNNADDGFLSTYSLKLLAGKNFSLVYEQNQNRVLINHTGAKILGFQTDEEAVGQRIFDVGNRERQLEIIGVVADFHNEGMSKPLYPMVWNSSHPWVFGYYTFLVDSKNMKEVVARLEAAYLRHYPNDPFKFMFADEYFNRQYASEARFGKFYIILTLLSLTISGLGLFGLLLFYLILKKKEIGIRKINGAKISEVMSMINRDFIKLVAVAFVIATPVSWYIMHKWLENFAYKTSLSWWIFALAGLLALGIALLTVSWQSWKAATRNPVEALRYE